jgi:hypothetical protein
MLCAQNRVISALARRPLILPASLSTRLYTGCWSRLTIPFRGEVGCTNSWTINAEQLADNISTGDAPQPGSNYIS